MTNSAHRARLRMLWNEMSKAAIVHDWASMRDGLLAMNAALDDWATDDWQREQAADERWWKGDVK